MDLVVVMVGHSHLKENLNKLEGKVVLDTRHIAGLQGAYTL